MRFKNSGMENFVMGIINVKSSSKWTKDTYGMYTKPKVVKGLRSKKQFSKK